MIQVAWHTDKAGYWYHKKNSPHNEPHKFIFISLFIDLMFLLIREKEVY